MHFVQFVHNFRIPAIPIYIIKANIMKTSKKGDIIECKL